MMKTIIIKWIIFSIIAVIIPIVAFLVKDYIVKKSIHMNKQRKNAILKMILSIILYWLCDLFYMAYFTNKRVFGILFGGMLVITIIICLVFFISSSDKKTKLDWFFIVQNTIIFLFLTIYFISMINNIYVREVLIPIIAAVYGGLITLIGVGLTIKHSDNIRKEEIENSARPLVFVVNKERIGNYQLINIDFSDLVEKNVGPTDGLNKYKINYFLLKNTDYSFSCFRGIVFDTHVTFLKIGQVFEKNQVYKLSFDETLFYEKDVNNLSLLLSDTLENYYALELSFKVTYNENNHLNEIEVLSGVELKKVIIDETGDKFYIC